MELNLKGKHMISLVRLITKLNIKKEINEFFKLATKNANKQNNISLKLKLALGELENNAENMTKVLEDNAELKEILASVQEDKRELMFDVVFFVMEKISEGEREIYKLLAEMYGVTVEEIEDLSFVEMQKAIMGVVTNKEIQEGFLFFFK